MISPYCLSQWMLLKFRWGNPDIRFIQIFTCFFINFIGCVGVRTRWTGWRAYWLMDARSTKDSSALRPAYRAVFPPNKRLTEQSTFTSWPFGKAGRMQTDWFHIKFVCDYEMGVDCWCAASQQPFFLWGIVAPGVPQKSWEVCAAGCLKLKTHLSKFYFDFAQPQGMTFAMLSACWAFFFVDTLVLLSLPRQTGHPEKYIMDWKSPRISRNLPGGPRSNPKDWKFWHGLIISGPLGSLESTVYSLHNFIKYLAGPAPRCKARWSIGASPSTKVDSRHWASLAGDKSNPILHHWKA